MIVDVETGCVVGINAAIRTHMEGTSFAIPINRVRDIMYDLAQGKQIHHGYLGMSLTTCSPEWARRNNIKLFQQQKQSTTTRTLQQQQHHQTTISPPSVSTIGSSSLYQIPEVNGAYVHRVFPRTPASKGDLRVNDVILEINGKRVYSADDARRLIDVSPIGVVRID